MSGSRNQCKAYHRVEKRKTGGVDVVGLHANWWDLIERCRKQPYTTFEKLEVHDGIPVSAGRSVEKVRFGASDG